MKKLNNTQKLAIQTLVRDGIEVEVMAKTLKVGSDVIKAYLEELKELLEKTEEAAKKKPKDSSHIGITNKTAGGRKGVTIMTEQASIKADDARNAGKTTPDRGDKLHDRQKGCIYRPFTDTIE